MDCMYEEGFFVVIECMLMALVSGPVLHARSSLKVQSPSSGDQLFKTSLISAPYQSKTQAVFFRLHSPVLRSSQSAVSSPTSFPPYMLVVGAFVLPKRISVSQFCLWDHGVETFVALKHEVEIAVFQVHFKFFRTLALGPSYSRSLEEEVVDDVTA